MIDRGFYRKERKGFNSVLCGFFAPFAVNCLNNVLTGKIIRCEAIAVETQNFASLQPQTPCGGTHGTRTMPMTRIFTDSRALPCAVDAVTLPPGNAATTGKQSTEIDRNRLPSTEVDRNRLQSTEIDFNRQKSTSVDRNRLQSTEVDKNRLSTTKIDFQQLQLIFIIKEIKQKHQ